MSTGKKCLMFTLKLAPIFFCVIGEYVIQCIFYKKHLKVVSKKGMFVEVGVLFFKTPVVFHFFNEI
jgi:hypothetical protein